MRKPHGLLGWAGAAWVRIPGSCRAAATAGAIAVVLIAAAGCTRADPAQAAAETTVVSILPDGPVAMPPKDSALVATGRAVARVMDSSGDVWPGFDPEAILIYWPYAPFPAVLVTEKTPPADWRAVDPGLGPGSPTVYFRTGALRGLVGNIALDYRLGDITATAVTLDVALPGALDFAFHEAFHFFQRGAFANAGRGDPVIPDSLVADAEYLALQEVEIRLLRAALEESNPARRTDLLHRYLAVRRGRLLRVDSAVEMAERHWELIEGTATWVGLKAATLGSPTARRDIARGVLNDELRDLPAGNQGRLAQRVVYHRSRGTGAALVTLLDDAGAEWRPVAEGGHRLDDLLARTLGNASHPDSVLVREVKRNAGFDTLLVAARSRLEAPLAGKRREDFEARSGYRIVVDLEAAPGPDGRLKFPTYNASGLAHTPDPGRTIYMPVENFSIDEPGVMLTARRIDLMVERRGAEPLRLTLRVDKLPATSRMRAFRAGELAISEGDFALRASRATVNQESDSVLHVMIRR